MPALFAFAARQAAGDFTAMLENVEMSPGQHFSVVLASDRARVLGTMHRSPQRLSLTYLQKHRAALPVKTALHHFPLQSQSQ